MKTPGILAALLAVLALTPSARAADDDRTRHTLHSEILDEERVVTVDLPASYEEETERPSPVLFVLDGESNLEHAVAVVDFLSERLLVPEMVVVGVHAGATRARDYLPADARENPGEADRFLDFLEEELLPFVEKSYTVAPLRLLSGHSYGGVFVTHALGRRPGLFRAFLAQSPYLDVSIADPLLQQLQSRLDGGDEAGAYYFANLGDEAELEAGFDRLEAILEGSRAMGPKARLQREADLRHMSTPMVGLHDGLVGFFRDHWPLPAGVLSGGGSEALAAHLDRLQDDLGYPVRYAEGAFQRATQGLLNGGDVKGAAESAGLYVEHHPRSPVAHFLRGAALASGGQRQAGIEAIEKAIALFDADPDPSQAPLRANMQRVLGQLRGD